MPSATYLLIRAAMVARKQVTCIYRGYARELCPVVLGHTGKDEKALTFQVGGGSRSGLPPGGEWRCLFIAEVRDARMREGLWREGTRHTASQRCVAAVDLDINVEAPAR